MSEAFAKSKNTQCIFFKFVLFEHFFTVVFYFRYVLISKRANGTAKNILTPSSMVFKALGALPADTCFEVTPPKVSQESIVVYEKYINIVKYGGYQPKPSDMDIYRKYASYK